MVDLPQCVGRGARAGRQRHSVTILRFRSIGEEVDHQNWANARRRLCSCVQETIRMSGVLAPARTAGVNWPGDAIPKAI